MARPDVPELIGTAINAAMLAGREILAVYQQGVEVTLKEDHTPLTEADRRAHRTILHALLDTQLPVLSEEGGVVGLAERQGWRHYWLVDPLDGTKEFIARNGEFTVNIALMESDGPPVGAQGTSRPIGGVIYAPVLDLLYFAWSGGGAYRQRQAGTSIAIPTYERASMAEGLPVERKKDRPFTVVGSRSHSSPETAAFVERMRAQHGELAFMSMGSALKMGLVAEGAADVYPRFAPTMEWDTAAGHAICMEAGRTITDMVTGAPMRYNKKELVNNSFIVE